MVISLKALLNIEATDTTQDVLLGLLLDNAEQIILNYLYPYGNGAETLPAKYTHKQLDLAVILYNRRGAEGEVSHSELGVSRTYENGSIPESFFRGLVPQCGVIRDADT